MAAAAVAVLRQERGPVGNRSGGALRADQPGGGHPAPGSLLPLLRGRGVEVVMHGDDESDDTAAADAGAATGRGTAPCPVWPEGSLLPYFEAGQWPPKSHHDLGVVLPSQHEWSTPNIAVQ